MPFYKKFTENEVSILKQTFLTFSYYPSKRKIRELAKSMKSSCLKIENWFKYNRRKMYFNGEFNAYKIRKTFNSEELKYLHTMFKSNQNPDFTQCQTISRTMKEISGYQVKNWFANQRRKEKARHQKKFNFNYLSSPPGALSKTPTSITVKRRKPLNRKKIITTQSQYKRKGPNSNAGPSRSLDSKANVQAEENPAIKVENNQNPVSQQTYETKQEIPVPNHQKTLIEAPAGPLPKYQWNQPFLIHQSNYPLFPAVNQPAFQMFHYAALQNHNPNYFTPLQPQPKLGPGFGTAYTSQIQRGQFPGYWMGRAYTNPWTENQIQGNPHEGQRCVFPNQQVFYRLPESGNVGSCGTGFKLNEFR